MCAERSPHGYARLVLFCVLPGTPDRPHMADAHVTLVSSRQSESGRFNPPQATIRNEFGLVSMHTKRVRASMTPVLDCLGLKIYFKVMLLVCSPRAKSLGAFSRG
jgi:hypothetical protein